MEDHFEIHMTEDQLRGLSSIALAHMGDAVYELLVRGWLCQHGKATGRGLHQATIRLVRAEYQAAYAEKILPRLTEEELAVFRPGAERPGAYRAPPCQPRPVRHPPRRWKRCLAGCISAAGGSGSASFLT